MTDTTATVYAIYEDGSTERQQWTGQGEAQFALSKPGRYVTESEYETFLAGVQAGNEAYEAQLAAAETSTLKGDYDALIALGLPDAMARRMSAYTGP